MSRVGKYLIARPTVTTGFFAKTVVFVYEDNEYGTAGAAITKPSKLCLADLAVDIDPQYPRDIHRIYFGGPVGTSSVMLLHTPDFSSSNTLHTGLGVDISSDTLMIEKMVYGNEPRLSRFVLGGSVWAPGQLDKEIAAGFWLESTLNTEIVFGLSGDAQWEAALESAGSEWVARYF